MSKSPLRAPVKTRYFPSGDQPCRYEGPVGVIRVGAPPAIGSVYTIDVGPLLIPSIRPSNESAWSLLQWTWAPVSIGADSRFARSKLNIRPLWL